MRPALRSRSLRQAPRPICLTPAIPTARGPDASSRARYDSWFAEIIATPGSKVPDGPSGAGLIIANRRSNAIVIIDMGGGYGGSTYDHLKQNGLEDGVTYVVG